MTELMCGTPNQSTGTITEAPRIIDSDHQQFSLGREPCALAILYELEAATKDQVRAAITLVGLPPDDGPTYRWCAGAIFG